MASYDKTKNTDYTLAVQAALKTLNANLGGGGVDGKWGQYTEAAYQSNKSAVDALVSGIGGGGLTTAQVDVPESTGYDELFSMGSALFAAQYEAQKRSAERQLKSAQETVEANRVQAGANLENAANARGFGRSSYVTDSIQKNDQAAQTNQTALLGNFSDALNQLEANRTSSAAQYATSMWQSQQSAIQSAQKFNAQQQQQTALAQWKQTMAEQSKASSGGGSSRKSSSSSAQTNSISKTLLENAAKSAAQSRIKAEANSKKNTQSGNTLGMTRT